MPSLYPVLGVGEPLDARGRRQIKLGTHHTMWAYVTGSLSFGPGAMISDKLEIGMPDKPVESFIVGAQCRLYGGQIAPRNFIAGDYLTIHEGVWAYGRNDIEIGHNCWFGRRCTLDAEGMFKVGNNLGAGQDTHLWSHIRHGDTLAGHRWLKYGALVIGDDVWLVGRTTTGPYVHGDRSMAMVESNLTKGMPENTIWGGNPAVDLTEKLGPPFVDRPGEDRLTDFEERFTDFLRANPDVLLSELSAVAINFTISDRTYRKTGHPLEVRFMRFLLPEAKFTPR